MYEQKVEKLANEILSQFQCYFDNNLGKIFRDEKLLNENPLAKVDAISRASRVICKCGYSFAAEVDTSSQIHVIKYSVSKK